MTRPATPSPEAAEVLCAACSSRFGAPRARPGDRVGCPLCGAEVEVGALVAERRRRARPVAPAPRLPRRAARRALVRTGWVALGLAAAALLWLAWDPLVRWLTALSDSTAG